MILHHYKLSPFSEKIRLMFGCCGLDWSSVLSPAMPPRPIVDPLAGGYRRIPVAQIGADIFCDTRIIASEIATLSQRPEMAVENGSLDLQEFVDHVDTMVFTAVVRSGNPTKSMRLLLSNFMPWNAYRFIKDRAGIARTSSLPRLSQVKALEVVEEFKANVEDKLTTTPFLFGGFPTNADFSSYHLIWFAKKITSDCPLQQFPKADSWFKRMSDMGHGNVTNMSKREAFKMASSSEPRAIDGILKEAPLIGSEVKIMPTDYAKNVVSGALVGEDANRWILARSTDQFGAIHVHFPKNGFEIAVL